MSTDPQRVQAIFLDVVENLPAERHAHVERLCDGDPELRHRVCALLEAHDDSGDFLDCPPPGIDVTETRPIIEQPGDTIGPYKLLQQIGEGGFGVVFLAEQVRPVRRRVALKVIKPGMDTRQVIARFEAERQALALMDHSSIAKVFDAGTTVAGRPYFVMELVQGAPITDYCNECDLATRERLELLLSVCHAVQHAHQKGVIHRDIKPTNVLVTIENGRPAPKIIDFGVAKALNQQLTEQSHVTAFAQMIGTPLYMSPEQAELSPLGVDTRSDIYSLGVLLYELLTGTTPFDHDRLRSASYDELRRILREEEPPRPSARLSTLAAGLATTVAGRQRTDARRLIQTMRGELDWIVMKCLEKDRNRRYETVDGLARDLAHYLHDEPVAACPPSAGYRFRKFARRNKAPLLAATAAFVTLLLLVAGLAISNRLIGAERARSEELRLLAQRKAAEEQRATLQARAEAAKSNAVVKLLQDMLAAAHPDSAGGNDYTVRQLLDQFSAGLDDRLHEQPEVAAKLHQIIGSVFTRLRLVDEAEPHLRQSLVLHRQVFGEDHTEYADSLRHLAWNLLEKDRANGEVETLARRALAIYRKQLNMDGALHSLWLVVLSLDGQSKIDDARLAANEALQLARTHDLYDHSTVPNVLHQLAWINIRKGDYAAAERLARESVERHLVVHGDAHPETAFGWTYLGAALHRQGRFSEAEDCYRKSLDIFRRSLPENHSYIRPTSDDLMWALRSQGKFEELIIHCREVVLLQPDNAAACNHLAWILATCSEEHFRNPEEAVELASKAVALAPGDASFWNTLGVARYRAGHWPAAIEALQRSVAASDGGDAHDWFFLAMSEWRLGNRETARDWHRKSIDRMEQLGSQANEELARFRAEADALLDGSQSESTSNDQ